MFSCKTKDRHPTLAVVVVTSRTTRVPRPFTAGMNCRPEEESLCDIPKRKVRPAGVPLLTQTPR